MRPAHAITVRLIIRARSRRVLVPTCSASTHERVHSVAQQVAKRQVSPQRACLRSVLRKSHALLYEHVVGHTGVRLDRCRNGRGGVVSHAVRGQARLEAELQTHINGTTTATTNNNNTATKASQHKDMLPKTKNEGERPPPPPLPLLEKTVV
jgi:hypothetical protein